MGTNTQFILIHPGPIGAVVVEPTLSQSALALVRKGQLRVLKVRGEPVLSTRTDASVADKLNVDITMKTNCQVLTYNAQLNTFAWKSNDDSTYSEDFT